MPAPTTRPLAEQLNSALELLSRKPKRLIIFAVLLALLPFITRPFNMDDPLFLWAARHIQTHPLNPYDFTVNWYGWDQPMWEVTKNPPLASYCIAFWAMLIGWSEVALHTAFLLPTIAVVLGTHRLATKMCQRPLLVALVTLFTPVFLISSSTIMCDVLMLAFWIWAVTLWGEALETNTAWRFAIAALLVALAALTKYFGICLLPLLVAWSLLRKSPPTAWLGWLAIPVGLLAAYQWATHALYGRGLLLDAADYATAVQKQSGSAHLQATVVGLTFAGACLASIVAFAPLLWKWRGLLAGIVASLLSVFLFGRNSFSTEALHGTSATAVLLQMTLWCAGGIGMIALTIQDIRRHRQPDSWLLAFWIWGTLVFAAFFNWSINGRTLLPAVIPAALLIVRRLENRQLKRAFATLAIPLLASAALSFAVTRADSLLAVAGHEEAEQVAEKYRMNTLWFEGHWGFQYYLQLGGRQPLDMKHSPMRPGDYVAIPSNNTNLKPLNPNASVPVGSISVQSPDWLSTMNISTGAGFYASQCGPLPFAFGRVPPEEVTIYMLKRPSTLR